MFWPVGTGDSTTVVVTDDVLVQVDLNDRDKADDDETPEVPVVDLLVDGAAEVDGRPFLAAFVLTHADKDHCSGFADLLEKATIGELWATPRMWREYLDDRDAPDLCEDAKAFHEEVKRRVEAVKEAVAAGEDIALGDRVLVVGYDTDEQQARVPRPARRVPAEARDQHHQDQRRRPRRAGSRRSSTHRSRTTAPPPATTPRCRCRSR